MTVCKKNRQEHKKTCPAVYTPLLDLFYVGKCCECVKLHRDNKCIPPCFFTKEQIQESKDFSIKRFVKINHTCNYETVASLGKVPDVVFDYIRATIEGVPEEDA